MDAPESPACAPTDATGPSLPGTVPVPSFPAASRQFRPRRRRSLGRRHAVGLAGPAGAVSVSRPV